jgi:hypothetical protein
LATGPRGLGYHAVFGKPTIDTIAEFELLWHLQQRTLLAETKDGREDMAQAIAIREIDDALQHPQSPIVLDPETMTPDEMEQIIASAR